jgi:type IV pilus assembly protein PilM
LKKTKTILMGLDLGSTCVKAVAVELGYDPPRLLHVGIAEHFRGQGDKGMRTAIEKAISPFGDRNSCCALSVGGPSVAVRRMDFPLMSAEELAGAIHLEASEIVALDLEHALTDFDIIRGGSEKRPKAEVIFAAVGKDIVNSRVSVVEECGFNPTVMDVDALAALSCVLMHVGKEKTAAVVNIGARYTNIAIGRDESIPFVRDVEIAGDSYTHAIQNATGLGVIEAESLKKEGIQSQSQEVFDAVGMTTETLLREVKRSIQYYESRPDGTKVEELYFCGGGSRLAGLSEAFIEALGIPVLIWNPFLVLGVDHREIDVSIIERDGPAFGVAVGLALREDAVA